MCKVLILGGAGFVGAHLSKSFDQRCTVVSTGRKTDIRDLDTVRTLVAKVKPDRVINLAAVTTLRESIKKPQDTYDINFMGTFNLLTALREYRFIGRMLLVSSSEVYGIIREEELPVNEQHHLKPITPYAVSKISAEALCYQWSQTENFEIVVVRPFNHIGPGQSEMFVVSDFAKQIIQIKNRLIKPELNVGDIDVTRDFTDVRDIVTAYKLLLEEGVNGGIYNVCSGKETLVRDIITIMCELVNIEIDIKQDKSRLRLSENRRVFGDNSKLKELLFWKPKVLKESLQDILDFWEEKIKYDVTI